MNIYAFIPFILAFFSLGAGIFVLVKAKRSYLSKPYFLASLSVFCYLFMHFCLINFTLQMDKLIFCIKILALGAFLIVPALLNILLKLPHGEKGLLKIIFIFSCLTGIFSSCYFAGEYPLQINSFTWGSTIAIQNMPYFLSLFNAILFLPLGIGVFWLESKRGDISDLAKRQINFIILSLILLAFAKLWNFLPAFGIDVYIFGLPLLTIAFISMYYSIVRYRSLEVDLILNRTLMALLFVIPLLILHIVISAVFLQLLGFIFSTTFSSLIIISMVLFTPYKRLLQKAVEQAVYRGRYDYQRVLWELSQTLTAILDFDQLLDYMIHIIVQTIEVKKMAVFLSEDEENQNFVLKSSYGIDQDIPEGELSFEENDLLVKRLKEEGKILIKSELIQFEDVFRVEEIFQPLSMLSAELIAPLFFKEHLIGFIVLSQKKSRNIYNQGDIDVLGLFALEASKAVEHVRLYREAIADNITDVFNQNYFLMRLREEIARSKRYGHPISLMFVDINNFPKANSSLVNKEEELLLKGIGLLLKTKVRNVDIIARYSGGKFAVILPETARSEQASTPAETIRKHVKDALIVAQRLRRSIEDFKNEYKAQTINITSWVGISYFDGVDDSFTEDKIIEQAETALAQAKKSEKNKVVCFNWENE